MRGRCLGGHASAVRLDWHIHNHVLLDGPAPIFRGAALSPAAFEHDRFGPGATVDSAAAVPDHLNVLDVRELLGQHPEGVQPAALDDE